jgi:hypothetical protein
MHDWSPLLQIDVALPHLIGVLNVKAVFWAEFCAEASTPRKLPCFLPVM